MTRTPTGHALRVGVAGLGWFGRVHLEAWSAVRGVEVVAVCDRDPAVFTRGRSPQDSFHVDLDGQQPQIPLELARFTSVEELLDCGIDLLDVVVTEAAHEECVRVGLEAGVDVVVEKPLAFNARAAESLIRLAERRDRRIYVAQVLRFDPRHVALAELARGRDLRHLSLSRHFQPSAHAVYGRTHPVLNAAIHDLDLAVWLVGGAPSRISGFTSHFFGQPHPDTVDLVLEWDGGLRAVVQNSWHLAPSCPYGFVFECGLQTSDGTFVIRSQPVLEAWTASGALAPELFFWPVYGGQRNGALVAELQHFADCARRGAPSDRVPLHEVLAVMRSCDAALESIAAGRPAAVRRPSGNSTAERSGIDG